MNQITIDCGCVRSPGQLHKALSEALCFPEWYGNNLDALYDCLSTVTTDTQLTLTHFWELGSFSGGFRRVLRDAEKENPHLTVTIL